MGPCALACGCHGWAILLIEQAAAGAEGGWGHERPSGSETAFGSPCAPQSAAPHAWTRSPGGSGA